MRPDPDKIIKEVATTFGIDKDIIEGKGQRNNMARNAAIYFVQRYTGLKNEEIGDIFGGIHYSAVSKASWRLINCLIIVWTYGMCLWYIYMHENERCSEVGS